MSQKAYVNPLMGKKIEKVVATLISTEGNYIMNVVNFEFINSFEKNFEHEIKEGLREAQEAGEMWIDPTPQLAITLGSVEGYGVITHRFNAKGYLNQDDSEVSDEMLNDDNVMVIGNYVCKKVDEGWERIEAPEKTATAMNMLFGFLNKLGFTNEDQSIEDALNTARTDKYVITAVVEEDSYQGKDRMVVAKFFKTKLEDMPNDDDDDMPSEADFGKKK